LPPRDCEANSIAARLRALLPCAKSGTLRFWGEWFGRPHDNVHRIVDCDANDGVLRIAFNEGEGLWVWPPHAADVNEQTFLIRNAARVRWEWFYYGRPKIDSNRYFMDFTKTESGVDAKTDIDWYLPNPRPILQAPAVEMF
jgi:hypothetical protein